MKLVDLHSDTIYKMYRLGIADINDPSLHVSLGRLLSVESLLQCSSIYNPRFEEGYSYTELKKQYAFYRSITDGISNSVKVLKKFEDIDRNYREGIRTILMTIEDAGPVEGRLERIQELYRMGVRLMTLTWNHENCFGFPNSRDREETERGLKPFGVDSVALMNCLGMVIDVSHLSDGGIADVCRLSRKPIVASHSNCRALSDHPRNLSDPLIRAIADSGGVVGVSVEPNFIGPGREEASLERWIDHIEHLDAQCGLSTVLKRLLLCRDR